MADLKSTEYDISEDTFIESNISANLLGSLQKSQASNKFSSSGLP